MTFGVYWGHPGRLPGGGGFWGQALASGPFPEEKLGMLCTMAVEASWGRRAWDCGAGTWAAVVLLMGGKRKRESGMTRGLWLEQLGGCSCPVLRCGTRCGTVTVVWGTQTQERRASASSWLSGGMRRGERWRVNEWTVGVPSERR